MVDLTESSERQEWKNPRFLVVPTTTSIRIFGNAIGQGQLGILMPEQTSDKTQADFISQGYTVAKYVQLQTKV
jgi:hypothetical protein